MELKHNFLTHIIHNLFESKISYKEALDKFATTLKKYFGNSSFYHNRNNPNYVAKSYAMAKKMCENTAFCDITDIYAADMDVVTHTYGYDSSNILLLADTQVVELQDSYGEQCDSDQDGLFDYQEAHTKELVDISDFLKEYCKYNDYTEEETRKMIEENGKIEMYNYSSNPVLPDSDFDGRLDNRDGTKLDNEYNSNNETNNYKNVNIKFAQDYRYFFMNSEQYYEELAEMGLVLSNMASSKNGRDKTWSNNNQTERYDAHGLAEYMWYMGNENMLNMTESDVPYIIGQHDTIMLMGKVNNAERTVITVAIGEKEEYKDILAANYDGSLGNSGSEDIHHQGYDYEAEKIYEQLVEYDNRLSNPRWKKAYFITGYGTGGAVANLVAKKFIDYKHNDSNIYCYTYQAPNTINRNNLTSKIHNTKYASIFNVENTDDIMLNLMGDDAGWTKYGVKKYLSVGDNDKTKKSWNKLTHDSYKGGTNFLGDLFGNIFGFLKGIIGFTNTNVVWTTPEYDTSELVKVILADQMEYTNPDMSEKIKQLVNNKEVEKAAINISRKGAKVIEQSRDGSVFVYPDTLYTQDTPLITMPNKYGGNAIIPYIIDTAKYYINYIGSYQKEKQINDGKVRATNKAALYYDYITTNNGKPFDIYDAIDENGVVNPTTYYDTEEVAYHSITGDDGKGKNVYYYDKFNELNNEKYEVKTIKNNKTKTDDYNKYAHYIGDDCSGFSQAVIYSIEMAKGSNEPRGMNGIAGHGFGLKNHNTSASMYQADKNTETSLKNLGYVKYQAANLDVDWLQPGDLLCSNSHVEYYVGNNYEITFKDESGSRNANKKSGIDDIIRSNYRKLTKTIYSYDKGKETYIDTGISAAQGTFGWGGVNDEFPTEAQTEQMYYFKKSDDGKCFKLYRSSSDIDSRNYDTVWRYER